MKRSFISLLTAFALLAVCCLSGAAEETAGLKREDWADDVKAAVNDFICMYGSGSEDYTGDAYAVSDFDNTASVFDMCEQFVIYQAEVMGYGFTPVELPEVLASGLGDMTADLSAYGYGSGSYTDRIADITDAYTYLWESYGPFTPAGLDETAAEAVRQDPEWAEFIAKMMDLYLLIGENESTLVSYPWLTYWFTGMTEDELYTLARAAFRKYGDADTCLRTISSDI